MWLALALFILGPLSGMVGAKTLNHNLVSAAWWSKDVFPLRGSFHKDKRPVFHQGSRYGLQLLTAPARTKFPSKMIKDVNLDTVGSRKMCVTVWSLPTVYFYRRAVLFF